MRLLNSGELSRYSSATLRALAVRMECILAASWIGSWERGTAFANLRTIRQVLAVREAVPD